MMTKTEVISPIEKANSTSEQGMSLLALMGMMTLFAIALLAVAPSVQQDVQREKELESIRRGEEIADAIKQYVVFHNGTKLPQSIDELLEGLPQGTKKRQILRPSAATDPLSEDGKWRLIPADPDVIAAFAKRVQDYNNDVLPANPVQVLDRYSVVIVNAVNMGDDDDTGETADESEVSTDNTPFIGVASQSKSKSVIAYYGIEKHSQWVFTPLFRGAGVMSVGGAGTAPPPPVPDR